MRKVCASHAAAAIQQGAPLAGRQRRRIPISAGGNEGAVASRGVACGLKGPRGGGEGLEVGCEEAAPGGARSANTGLLQGGGKHG